MVDGSSATFIKITIRDNGPGVNPDELPLIAEKYYRGSNSKNAIGYGLGLYLCKTYMDKQKGGMEYYNDNVFVQDNQSSSTKGVLRGLHFQKEYAQDKLVRVISGEVYDVAVDLRKGSATYGKGYGVLLSSENKKEFFIPKGFAHGFLVLSDYAEFFYKVSDFYHPGDEGGLLWNDPEIGIEWPIPEGMELNINERDRNWPTLAELK